MQVKPYLYFDGRCEEAIEFYRKVLGAEVEMMMRFKENPEPQFNPPDSGEKIMHASFRIGESTIMASDGDCRGTQRFQGISLAVNAPNAEAAERIFAALGEGGQVQMPLAQTFFAPRFGMVADRFGVSWMVIADA